MSIDRSSRSRVLGLVAGRSGGGKGTSGKKGSGVSGRGKSLGRKGATGSKPRSWRRALVKIALAMLLIWLVACFLVVAEPTVNKPARVDAILVLGPSDADGRATAAFALARAHYASTVVVSVGPDRQLQVDSACRNQNPAYQVICFQPDPGTTQGEAREVGRLAAQHGWRSIIVVTSKYHISRARLIIGRCMAGKVLMVAAPGKPSVITWAYEFAYQTGGYIKAFLHRDC